MDLGFTDRAYIVTGATSGLGRATAEVLVAEGARVVVSSRRDDAVEALVGDLGADSATGVVADNAEPETPRRLIEASQQAYGRLDGALISVGGPAAGGPIGRTDDEWRHAVDSVLLGGIRLGSEIADALGEGGSIAFVLSTSTKQPMPNLAISNALRPGLAMYAKTLADELGPRGIRVNGLLPGRVETERVQYLDSLADDPQAAKAAAAAQIPLRRYGQPEEFGRAAAFLLSPALGYITGTMLPVDGGLTRAL